MVDGPSKWLQQLRKGSTRLAILRVLSEGDSYGYEIIEQVDKQTLGGLVLAEGNMYPALRDLEEAGILTTYWRDAGMGVPRRKYYHLTKAGSDYFRQIAVQWAEFAKTIARLLGPARS